MTSSPTGEPIDPAAAHASDESYQPGRRAPRHQPDNTAPIVIGIILIVVGALFLVRQFLNIDWGQLWPVIVIVIGLVLVVSAFVRGPGRR